MTGEAFNYDLNGPRMKDHMIFGGLDGRILVDLSNGDRPYVVVSRPRLNGSQPVFDGEYVDAQGGRVTIWQGTHQDDPSYAPDRITSETPSRYRVSDERFEQVRLRGVGD